MLTREAKLEFFWYITGLYILYKILIKLPSEVFSAMQTVLLLISGICGCFCVFVCMCVCFYVFVCPYSSSVSEESLCLASLGRFSMKISMAA